MVAHARYPLKKISFDNLFDIKKEMTHVYIEARRKHLEVAEASKLMYMLKEIVFAQKLINEQAIEVVPKLNNISIDFNKLEVEEAENMLKYLAKMGIDQSVFSAPVEPEGADEDDDDGGDYDANDVESVSDVSFIEHKS